MKKILTIILVLWGAILITGCADDSNDSSDFNYGIAKIEITWANGETSVYNEITYFNIDHWSSGRVHVLFKGSYHLADSIKFDSLGN